MDHIIIESHFGVPDNLIRSYTRNKCSEDLVGIINEIATILYPDDEFEILLLPSEPGTYKDVIKLLKKKPLEAVTAVTTIGILTFAFLTYLDSHSEHSHDTKMQIVDDTAKCLALRAQLNSLDDQYGIDKITDEKLNEVCGNIKLKKLKNERYQTLIEDDMVANEQTIIKDFQGQTVFEKTIQKEEFNMCIEYLPENEEYEKKSIEGVIELISLVVRQKKEGKGRTWYGTYYGENIEERGIVILENGQEITFYMQDDDFKEKIKNHEIVFSSDDNIRAKIDIKGELNIDKLINPSFYVKEVISFNKDIIEHKVKTKKIQTKPNDDQMTFEI